jgi:hypothetical protein
MTYGIYAKPDVAHPAHIGSLPLETQYSQRPQIHESLRSTPHGENPRIRKRKLTRRAITHSMLSPCRHTE